MFSCHVYFLDMPEFAEFFPFLVLSVRITLASFLFGLPPPPPLHSQPLRPPDPTACVGNRALLLL